MARGFLEGVDSGGNRLFFRLGLIKVASVGAARKAMGLGRGTAARVIATAR